MSFSHEDNFFIKHYRSKKSYEGKRLLRDLNHVDFGIWESLVHKIYKKNIKDINKLKKALNYSNHNVIFLKKKLIESYFNFVADFMKL